MLTKGDDLLIQSIFYPIEMYSKRRDGMSLQVQVEGPGYTSKRFGYVNTIDSSAILNGNQLSVFLVNRDLNKPMEVNIRLGDASVVKLLNAEVVTGKDPKLANTFECPNQIRCQAYEDVSISGGVATISLPPMSVYAGTFEIAH
jgi:alpha-N-arabinofuranosidase